MTELKPCPWQKENEPCKLEIAVLDDEGNYYGEPGCDYEQDPFSGGPWYTLDHSGCSAGEYSFGKFSSVDELIEAWNTRAEREVGISKFQKITGTSYIEAKSILTSLKQAGAKVVE